MKSRFISSNASLVKPIITTLIFFSLTGCASITDIVPQIPNGGSSNSVPVVGADIAQANAFLTAGRKREAAAAYFAASQNYRSPESERLILQAAELASVFKDPNLTQRYLSPLNFDQLSAENKTRFRLVQAQLALNDRNFRETLRILPQRVNDIPTELGDKVLSMRMAAVQGSGDKLALVQELVLQETSLKESYQVSLNHDRIWGHAKQIPAFQLEEAKNSISHPIVKNWLSLAQLSRISSNGPADKRKTLRSDLGRWIQNNSSHPGMSKALALLNAPPTTVVTPYRADAQKPVIIKPVVKAIVKPVITSTVAPVVKAPVVSAPVVKPPVVEPTQKTDPSVRALYESVKKQIQ